MADQGVMSITDNSALSLRHLRKSFGGVVAVEDFSLDLAAGEIVALVGDNGAGKSTVVKMISGVHTPDSGRMNLEGARMEFSDAAAARRRGIEVVHQDLALVNNQSVYMNMFLGREIVHPLTGLLHRSRMRTEARRMLADLNIEIPSTRIVVHLLSGGQRQGVAIARATGWATKIVLLDEPTAALGVAETEKVEHVIASLRERHLAVMMISHSLDQVLKLSDRICVLRRGRQVGIRQTSMTGKNEIVSMITGLN